MKNGSFERKEGASKKYEDTLKYMITEMRMGDGKSKKQIVDYFRTSEDWVRDEQLIMEVIDQVFLQ